MAETLSNQASENRKGDGAMVVVQNNEERALRIDSINEVALAQLGYAEEELVGRRLEVVLGQRTALAIDEDLEYEDDAPDMADLLARQREVRFRTRTGEELTLVPAIHRIMAEDRHGRFQIVLPNERENTAKSQLKHFIRTNLDGHKQLDDATGLPNRATAEAYLRSISHYMAESQTEAAFAVLKMDRYEKSLSRYGSAATVQLIRHVANCCNSTFRSEDVVFVLDGPNLGLLLIDISRESVRVVLNRLRWNIRTHTIDFGGKADFATTVTIAFGMLGRDYSDALLMEAEKAVAGLEADARNVLIELGA